MKKESITIYADNEVEANKIRDEFKKQSHDNKYRLNIIISGNDDPVLSLSQFLIAKMK